MKPMTQPHELVALIDMDGTVADFDGAMRQDLALLSSPDEVIPEPGPADDPDPWIEQRKRLIKTQPGWWRDLPIHQPGMDLVELLKEMGFDLMVLTKGPWKSTQAWTEKVEWCRKHLPDVPVTITEDKGLMYGKVLVDDWPAYGIRWLQWRPRGLLIVPAWPWNTLDKYPKELHYNIIRYTGRPNQLRAVATRLQQIKDAAR
jgi:5'-nucleotidase